MPMKYMFFHKIVNIFPQSYMQLETISDYIHLALLCVKLHKIHQH